MIERKIVALKKDELSIKEFVKRSLGKGKISGIKIERTPLGERIIVLTSRPGSIIGKRGESIQLLTESLKEKFKLQNPKVEISEVVRPEFDAQYMSDQIALSLERFGSSSFKIIAYRTLEKIKNAGALGCEIVLSGKLPGEKAKTWRFTFGYLKKTGESAELVNRAQSIAITRPGVTGVKISILPPDVLIPDRIVVPKNENKAEMEITEEVVEEKAAGENPSENKKEGEEVKEKEVKTEKKKTKRKSAKGEKKE